MGELLGCASYFGQLGGMHLAKSPLGNCVDIRLERWSHSWLPSWEFKSWPVYYRYLLGWTGEQYTHVSRTDHTLTDRDLEGLRNMLVLVHTKLCETKTVPISITQLLYWVQCKLLLAESAAVRCFKCPTWWHVLPYGGFCVRSKAAVWMSLNPEFPAVPVIHCQFVLCTNRLQHCSREEQSWGLNAKGVPLNKDVFQVQLHGAVDMWWKKLPA